MGVALQGRHPVLRVLAVPPAWPERVAHPQHRLPEGRGFGPALRGERIASRARESSVLAGPSPRPNERHQREADQREIVAASKDSCPLRQGCHTSEGLHFGGEPQAINGVHFAALSGDDAGRRPALRCCTRLTRISSMRFAALRAAVPTGGRRSKPSPRFFSVGDTRSRCALRSGAGLKSGGPSRRRCLSRWWRRRESNPRPKVFCNDVYMHIRVVGGNPRPKAPFPLSVPRRINPANRGSEPIPCAHRRLGKTAGKARLGRRPFPPGRRGQEERGYLSSQCQFSVGFCFVSTVYERWTPDMQSLLHIPSSNPVRPPSSRD